MIALYLALGVALVGQVRAFWRLPCNNLLSTQRLDPIINPGGISGHVHAISGGSALAPTVAFSDLRNSQCSSCYVREDMSLYWTPNLWVAWANGSFSPVPQVGGVLVYYLQRGNVANHAFPDGFRMVAGNPTLRTYDSSSLAQRAITYTCLDYTRGNTYPQLAGIPSFSCKDGLRAQVFFPSCWDGQHVDSSDHKSHVAYPDGVDNGNCPPGFPIRLVSLFYEVTFDTWSLENYRSQALNSTQPFVFAMGDGTGYGFHGDFINGWDGNVLQSAVDTCTDDSGVIEKCDKFTFFPQNNQCHVTPSVNEPVSGMLPKLPGCNPVSWGPSSATGCSGQTQPQMINNTTVYQTKNPPSSANDPNAPHVVTSGSGYAYTGCYPDNGVRTLQTSLTQQATTTNGMTPATCLAACKAAGYKYCGLEYGQECWADNAIKAGVTPVDDGNCAKVCTGDSSSICGDGNLLTLYTVGAAPVSSPVASPSSTTQTSQTQNSLLVSTTTTQTPTSTSTSSTVKVTTTSSAPATPSNQPSINGYASMGCLYDNGPRTFGTSLTSKISGQMTPQACIAAAKAGGWRYAGTEYAQECWVANYMTNNTGPAERPANDCNMACKGDSKQMCGGPNRLSAYSLPNWTPPLAANPGPAGSKFLGCFTDNPSARVLRTGKPGGSVAICVQNCAAAGFSLAGTEYGGECYCDNQISNGGAIASPSNDPYQAGCNMACPQNQTEACGGGYPARLSVYQLPAVAPINAAKTTSTKTTASPRKTKRALLL